MANFLLFKELGEGTTEFRFRDSKLFWPGVVLLLACWFIGFPILYKWSLRWDREKAAVKKLELISAALSYAHDHYDEKGPLNLERLETLVDLGLLENSDLDFGMIGYSFQYKSFGKNWWVKASPLELAVGRDLFIDQRSYVLYSVHNVQLDANSSELPKHLTAYHGH
ncbi:MAG: hypothetical protein P1V97_01900 [Planctomycetota bacterium]|nr:hypothetical protein [Planctomycetota bacterium]